MISRKTGQETTLLESVPHGGIFMDNNYKGMADISQLGASL